MSERKKSGMSSQDEAMLRGLGIVLLSEEEAGRREAERKAALGLLDLDELERISYPTYFTATFDYFATGEGRTIGVSMQRAHSSQHLLDLIERDFGPYFGQMAEVACGLVILPIAEYLLPKVAIELVQVIRGEAPGQPCHFSFAAQLHFNYS